MMLNKIVALVLLLLNLYNYQYGLNKIIIFLISLFVICLYVFLNVKKAKSLNYIFLQLMIFTWPFAWTNIFGTDISEFQLTWFLISAFLFIFANIIKKLKIKKSLISLIAIIGIIYSILPLFLANSFNEGLSDFITIFLFLALVLVSYSSKNTFSEEEYNGIVDSFIFESIICSIGILFQYFMYKFFSLQYFKIHLQGSFVSGSTQSGCELLLEDPSCSAAMLGCGVIMSLIRTNKNKIYYLISIIILLGLVFTSRRTGIVGLLLIFPFFFLTSYKGIIKKFISIFILLILGVIILYTLAIARPYESASQIFDSNGRLPDYYQSLKLGLENPLGIGYGDEYLKSKMIYAIPHNSILRWYNFGGIFLIIPLVFSLFFSILNSKENKNYYAMWPLLYSIIIMNFIPDILNGKFLYIIIAIALNYKISNINQKEGCGNENFK